MKKIIILALTVILTLSLCACGGNAQADGQNENSSAISSEVQPETSEPDTENGDNEIADNSAGETTPITLTIGDTVLNGYLNDSDPAKSLIARLPLTVTLNDSGNDFCGGSLDIEYSDSDVQSGYKNGDLAFWPPASNFVIFVDDEENSADTGNLVILGKITEPQEALDALEGRIDVTIALAGEMDTPVSAGTENNEGTEAENETEVSEVKIKITVGDTELFATLEDNATTQAIIEQMPMTLPMMDLYGREMCYRYGAYALPTDNLQSDGYEVGDIAYWAPGGSLVILYKQNGEQFERQHLGHIDSGVEVFENTGDADVTFELVTD
ncbi:hypothetical protein D7X33_19995 [Butyricicoccus sp. 1XD8-22]|nr:hypothetical protein D7X33_19995 [Butyricicoccus sp. 1XD8-22]